MGPDETENVQTFVLLEITYLHAMKLERSLLMCENYSLSATLTNLYICVNKCSNSPAPPPLSLSHIFYLAVVHVFFTFVPFYIAMVLVLLK